jgi:8-hydroxy-5-deazaflavin:NADPH oxidoreductase
MKIAVIGTGNVGGSLAKRFSQAGHTVVLGVRDINNFKGKELLAEVPQISAKSIPDAAAESEIILIAAATQAVKSIAESLGNVKDKVIIDAMNSVFEKPKPYSNTTEALLDLTNCKDIVKCFNSTGFENMLDTNYGGIKIDMFAAGDSAKAKETAVKLSKDIGYENCYDFGGSDKFELIEQFAMCWINLAIMQGNGRNIAFKVLMRQK